MAEKTLNYILKKFNLKVENQKMPIPIINFCRNDLAILFHELGFKTGAEIGVKKGYYSKILCLKNPGLKLFSIDPWRQSNEYPPYPQSNLDQFFEQTKKRLKPFGCEIIRKSSMEAVESFGGNSLDFVFIDGDHRYKSIMDDLIEWSRRVKSDGIVSGHDWEHYRKNDCDVIEAVYAYTQTHEISPWFVIQGHYDEKGINLTRPDSFFWVKK